MFIGWVTDLVIPQESTYKTQYNEFCTILNCPDDPFTHLAIKRSLNWFSNNLPDRVIVRIAPVRSIRGVFLCPVAKRNHHLLYPTYMNRAWQMPQLCVIKLIVMTHTTHNIAGLDGSVLVPVLSVTGILMAYLLPANPQGIVEEFYPAKAMVRQYVGNTQAIPPQQNTHTRSQMEYYLPLGFIFNIQVLASRENKPVNLKSRDHPFTYVFFDYLFCLSLLAIASLSCSVRIYQPVFINRLMLNVQ
jgi:hypothetical protein